MLRSLGFVLLSWVGLEAALGWTLLQPSAAASQGQAIQAPADPASILIVMADDLGVDALPLYGLAGDVPPDLTPNLGQLASQGVLFETAWTNPKCSPTRAELETGRYAFRTGIGNVMEAGDVGLSPAELTLPEMLARFAPVPYETSFFGKWHLERPGSSELCPATEAHGYQHFDGTLFAVSPASGYCNWKERLCDEGLNPHGERRSDYMPAYLFDEASEWTSERMRAHTSPWFCLLAPQLPYEILHVPPAELQDVRSGAPCSACPGGTRACYDAALQAFDTKLGELFASLGPDWMERVTVIFLGDNGTPNGVNTYWPANRAKTTLFEGGVRVPFLVAGHGVDPALRGTRSTQLVSSTDVYRTVAALAGVDVLPARIAEDSFDLSPCLAWPAGGSGRTHLVAETFSRNALAPPYPNHRVAIRDQRFKLIYDWTDRSALYLFDLAADPREGRNLLLPAPPAASTPAGRALADLTARVHGLLSP